MYERTLTAYNEYGHPVVISRQHASRRTAKRLGWKPGLTRVWHDPSGNRYVVSDGYMPGAAPSFADMPSRLVR